MPSCSSCGQPALSRSAFSKAQLTKHADARRCKRCVAGAASVGVAAGAGVAAGGAGVAAGVAGMPREKRAVGNFVSAAGVGCHIAHHNADWLVGVDAFDPEDFGLRADDAGSAVPDLSVDPETGLLSAINPSHEPRCVFVSVVDHKCVGADGRELASAAWRDDAKGTAGRCVTFVLLVPPRTVFDVCEVCVEGDVASVRIHSDVQRFVPHHPSPSSGARVGAHDHRHDDPRLVFDAFPLAGAQPFLCTQGFNGRLTHFAHCSTFHAVDLACAEGTPVLSVGDGHVVEVTDHNVATGPHVAHLFAWNSVVVELDSGVVVEYVHIRARSSAVAPGERVRKGQKLCEAGAVGFCPEPHLHMEVHLARGAREPSVPFSLRCEARRVSVVPMAGAWYRGTELGG